MRLVFTSNAGMHESDMDIWVVADGVGLLGAGFDGFVTILVMD